MGEAIGELERMAKYSVGLFVEGAAAAVLFEGRFGGVVEELGGEIVRRYGGGVIVVVLEDHGRLSEVCAVSGCLFCSVPL